MVINNHLESNKMMLCIGIGFVKNKHTIQYLNTHTQSWGNVFQTRVKSHLKSISPKT
jgi:hypothetical protein